MKVINSKMSGLQGLSKGAEPISEFFGKIEKYGEIKREKCKVIRALQFFESKLNLKLNEDTK